MILCFSEKGWSHYLYWQTQGKTTIKRINEIIKSINRAPFTGMGKPEQLKQDFSGYWSRRITREHRIVYKVEDDIITVALLKHHY